MNSNEQEYGRGRDIKKQLTNLMSPRMIKTVKKTKVVRKRSTHRLFAEREVQRLKDIPEKDMWKVAFEPEC